MTKRRESLVAVLWVLPWWGSAIVAAIAYVLLAFAAPHYLVSNLHTAHVGIALKNSASLAAGFFLLIGAASFIRSLFIRRKYNDLASIEHIRQLPWRQFESIVGEAFRRRGYAAMENAVDGPDGGIDLVLRRDGAKFYVQCKQWKYRKVGVKPIRELHGVIAAGEADGGFFVCSGEYTNEAHDFARKCDIKLIDGPALVEMIALTREPEPFMDPTHRKTTNVVVEPPIADPTCPACGSTMVRRNATRGTHAGSPFWGCSSYPRCRGIRST